MTAGGYACVCLYHLLPFARSLVQVRSWRKEGMIQLRGREAYHLSRSAFTESKHGSLLSHYVHGGRVYVAFRLKVVEFCVHVLAGRHDGFSLKLNNGLSALSMSAPPDARCGLTAGATIHYLRRSFSACRSAPPVSCAQYILNPADRPQPLSASNAGALEG